MIGLFVACALKQKFIPNGAIGFAQAGKDNVAGFECQNYTMTYGSTDHVCVLDFAKECKAGLYLWAMKSGTREDVPMSLA